MASVHYVSLLASLAAVSGAACGACEPSSSGGPGAAGSIVVEAGPAPSHPILVPDGGPIHTGGGGPLLRRPCRIIQGSGNARLENGTDAGAPLLVQGPLMSGWVDLDPASQMVLKDPHSTRETTFRGPGRIRGCVNLEEESWVATGSFASSPGAGESPGAEEWVVTPLGVVRYGASKLTVDVKAGPKTSMRLLVSGGLAFMWPAADATAHGTDGGAPSRDDDGWIRADVGAYGLTGTGATGANPLSVDGARAALGTCTALAKSTHDLSARLLAGAADGGTVAAQVSTRRQARAACTVAGLRIAALPTAPAVTALQSQLNEAITAWSSVPESPTSPPAPSSPGAPAPPAPPSGAAPPAPPP